MKSSHYHIIAQKPLRCKLRRFQLDQGALVFLQHGSTPMVEWLQEIHINDSEALFGDTDILLKIPTSFTRVPKPNSTIPKPKRAKKQLYERLKQTNQK